MCGVPQRSILRPLLLGILSDSLSESFFGIGSLCFSETQHGIRGRCSVERDRAIFFIYFFPKNGPKIGFFNILENLAMTFSWIWSTKTFCIICCILAEIPFLGKIFSLDKCQNALGQSDCRIFKFTASLEQNDEKAWLLAFWYKFMEIKSWLRNIRGGVVRNGCGHSGFRTLKLTVS